MAEVFKRVSNFVGRDDDEHDASLLTFYPALHSNHGLQVNDRLSHRHSADAE